MSDWLEEAAILRRRGQSALADCLEQCARDVKTSDAEDFLAFLTEGEAMLYSGETARWLQKRFVTWEREGHARKEGRTRYYRKTVLTRRAETAQAFEAGRLAARRSEQ